METKGIDLTRCNNCYFKAVIDGITVEGRIVAKEDMNAFLTDENGHNVAFLTSNGLKDVFGNSVEYFEIIPRDPETYKDWQVGDIVYNPEVAYTQQKEVIFRSGELVVCKDAIGDISGGYTCDQLFQLGYSLVLTDIEKQIIEERKREEWKPQDGDICYLNAVYEWLFIKKGDRYLTLPYACLRKDGFFEVGGAKITVDDDIKKLRPATDEEKQRLFDAMAREGKRWNAEKKVVEDIPKPCEFKKGEPVLARNYDNEKWELYAFMWPPEMGRGVYGLTRTNGDLYDKLDCIPYNKKTMHLLGTNEDYKEE